ncbi:hypothetical protein NA439_04470, partial [Salmonella sp. NW580]
MSIIYFITTQDIDTFQKKLQETLLNAVTMPFPLLFDKRYAALINTAGNDSNLLIVFYVQIMPDDFVMQLHR